MLDRDLAALELASRHGINININKLSTPSQRAAIREARAGRAPVENDRSPAGIDFSAVRPVRAAGRKEKAKRKTKGNSVFVVHGRDGPLRKSMFEFLRALGLQPLEWNHAVKQAKGNNPDVGDIVDAVMEKAQVVVVMFSPDDLAQLKEHFCNSDDHSTEGRLQGQARPNVLFEAGLALGRHPEKTILVQVGKVRAFSDIAGKHLVKLTDDHASRIDLANRLDKAGAPVDRTGSDWMSAGNFEPTQPKVEKRTLRKER
jgi:predicted nucleotide-binding protein